MGSASASWVEPGYAFGRPREGAAGALVADLYEKHSHRVLGLCRMFLRDRVEAEDAMQQTFLSAYTSVLGGNEPREPGAWLAAIARNECWARGRSRQTEPLDESDGHASAGDALSAAIASFDLARLCAALRALPRRERETLLLHELAGCTYAELAELLGISERAVDSLMTRARRRLRSSLSAATSFLPLPLRGLAFKLAATGAAAVGIGTAVTAVVDRPGPHPLAAPAIAPAPAVVHARPRAVPHAAPRAPRPAPRRRAPVRQAALVRPTPVITPAHVVPARPAPAPPVARVVAPLPPPPPPAAAPVAPPPPEPAAAPAPPQAEQSAPAPPPPPPAPTTTDTATTPVAAATQAVDDTVTTATQTVDQTVGTATKTASGALQTVTQTVTSLLGTSAPGKKPRH